MKSEAYQIHGFKVFFQEDLSTQAQKIKVQISYLLHMVFRKDQCLVPYSSYSTSTIVTKLLYITMYTIFQMIQIYSTVINLFFKKNKHINHDLKHLCQWLRSNKISSNASKTEIIILKHKQTIITKHMNFRISGQKINTTTSI